MPRMQHVETASYKDLFSSHILISILGIKEIGVLAGFIASCRLNQAPPIALA